jgi:hypothetical protein
MEKSSRCIKRGWMMVLSGVGNERVSRYKSVKERMEVVLECGISVTAASFGTGRTQVILPIQKLEELVDLAEVGANLRDAVELLDTDDVDFDEDED